MIFNEAIILLNVPTIATVGSNGDLIINAANFRMGQHQKLSVIGDLVIDIEAARAAGVAVWTIPTGSCSPEELDQAGPDGCITSIADLLDALPPL